MLRLISAILLAVCVVASLQAQAPPEVAQEEKERDATAQAAASAAKPQFPLDAFTEFSAVMVGSIMEPGEGTAEGHIYRSGKLMRMEGPEGHGYFITDLSTRETFGLSTAPCVHDSHPFIRASPFSALKPGSTVERTATGKETLDGHSCQIEEVTISSAKPVPSTVKMRLWEAEDLQGFPIKVEFLRPDGHGATIRYKNVVLGPQDPTLFIHPKSCEALPEHPKKAPAKATPAAK
jgi:hypothetical protein